MSADQLYMHSCAIEFAARSRTLVVRDGTLRHSVVAKGLLAQP